MLFSLNLQTPQCSVFALLNAEFLHFLDSSVNADVFSEALFRTFPEMIEDVEVEVPSVCWNNKPTREKFHSLWEALPIAIAERRRLSDQISQAQDIIVFFNNTQTVLPELEPATLFEACKALTTHLFTRTKDLAQAKSQSNNSIEIHYQNFVRGNSNSHLCPICGTALLSQNRESVADEEQWRSDYDHVLCKDKYPIYSVHPGNFIPTCHICNSKAKGAKDVLRDNGGQRRVAFYPLPPSQESCEQFVAASLHLSDRRGLIEKSWETPLDSASILFPNAPADIVNKIDVWDEVYNVTERVEQHLKANFCERIAADLRPVSFDDFCEQLQRYSRRIPVDYRKSEWRFWWQKVYEFLSNQNRDYLHDVWILLDWKLRLSNDADMADTFNQN
ncbi:TPA: hypothetical protein QHR59_002944 [Klebsiella aerogenes]|uniref:hypothetical protein n=1 Tax=Klebsiella TaxID=570 RepID=UPI000A36C06F|nr:MULTISPECIES: hypothetical protein [Klebsiella]ATM89608.1 hypothetical protein CRN78_03245 [Klebsiella aerogenes]EIV5433965.1 hypothetical protein [Klebsiella aerogenes]ELA2559218.1 hypothetical protein [Klebsiella aerogenes]MCW4604290.1 hypothetical protein [Klebsiella quasipneumoniae]MCW4621732.1 hypothetical protein [Klebsiella quasipneumoniae]